jgi:hypothetical protein
MTGGVVVARGVSIVVWFDLGSVDILVYTPEEFALMRQVGNAFAEMIAEDARVIYGRPAES